MKPRKYEYEEDEVWISKAVVFMIGGVLMLSWLIVYGIELLMDSGAL